MTKLIKVKYDDLTEVAQSAPQAVEFEEIASGSVSLPVNPNKSIFLDSLDQEFKAIDSSGVVTPFGGGGTGGLGLSIIDHTSIPAQLVRNTEYVCDFSAATTDLTLTLPVGTGSETFRILVNIIQPISDTQYSVSVLTQSGQLVKLDKFPSGIDGVTDIQEPAALYFTWEQSDYQYSDTWFPNFQNLTGNVPFDDITVSGVINGGEATSTQAGTVSTAGQTFAGDKTFEGKVTVESMLSTPRFDSYISSGGINAVSSYMRIDTEGSAATDDLTTINNGNDGEIVILAATSASRNIVIKHNVGNIITGNSSDFTLTNGSMRIGFMYASNDTKWVEIFRSVP